MTTAKMCLCDVLADAFSTVDKRLNLSLLNDEGLTVDLDLAVELLDVAEKHGIYADDLHWKGVFIDAAANDATFVMDGEHTMLVKAGDEVVLRLAA